MTATYTKPRQITIEYVRPGDQITAVNLSQVAPGGLVGALEPHVPWKTDLFWVHGGNIGVEIRW